MYTRLDVYNVIFTGICCVLEFGVS